MTQVTLRESRPEDVSALQALTVLAYEPIFASFAAILGEPLYSVTFPNWQTLQSDLVASLCQDETVETWVAEADAQPIGLVALKFYENDRTGEVYFLVVHPAYQNQGVGTRLNEFAVSRMREAGMALALIRTGGDDAHAAARRSYEKAGFTALPQVMYLKSLL